MTGPLQDVRVIELGGMGPGPFGTMMLAELGADVIRVDRAGGSGGSGGGFPGDPRLDSLNRGKRSIVLNLKDRDAIDSLLALIDAADVLVDPFRPGVAERLGVGPDVCLARNPRLAYARMTGWGQDGPRALAAGHDINYIAPTGVLSAIGESDGAPQIPLNLVGDFGGGGTYLVIGILAALREAERSGHGQVIDVAIADGTSHLLASIHGLMAGGAWKDERGANFLDGGAPFYHVYETSDGRYMSVGAIEPQFYAALISVLSVDGVAADQMDQDVWPATTKRFAAVFAGRSQAEWVEAFEGVDACVVAVQSLNEAAEDPHLKNRGVLRMIDGAPVAAAAPRFSRYTTGVAQGAPMPGEHTKDVFRDWGVGGVEALLASGAAAQWLGAAQKNGR
jgi:alpha-methylacyl-CoA racemase